MTCLQMILARQRGRAWTVVRQPRESQMGESNLDNQQYPPIRKSRHTKAAAWKETRRGATGNLKKHCKPESSPARFDVGERAMVMRRHCMTCNSEHRA